MNIPYNPTILLVESYVGIYKIYTLKNPFTDEIFYVGQTMQELQIRLNGHIGETGANREKINYIKEIISNGGRPIIEAIEVIPTRCYIDKVMVNERELYWIKVYKEKGCILFNKAGIDSDGTSREYRSYLSSIRRGETSYHYYVCGKTKSGCKVYDEQKLSLDGFVLNVPKEEFPQEQIKEPLFENRYLKERLVKAMGEFTQSVKRPPPITTEIFPAQPSWSADFKAALIYSDDDEFSHWHEFDDDDCDYEDEELENDMSDYEENLQLATGPNWYRHVVDVYISIKTGE